VGIHMGNVEVREHGHTGNWFSFLWGPLPDTNPPWNGPEGNEGPPA
jgi:hypothetical protein